jgi:hypothetical protein
VRNCCKGKGIRIFRKERWWACMRERERQWEKQRQRQRQRAYVLFFVAHASTTFCFYVSLLIVWRGGWWWRWFNGVDRETVLEREREREREGWIRVGERKLLCALLWLISAATLFHPTIVQYHETVANSETTNLPYGPPIMFHSFMMVVPFLGFFN